MKKMYLICITFILTLSLCGCQLARSDGTDAKNGDRLVGVYITHEKLESNNSGRIYATLLHKRVDGAYGAVLMGFEAVFEEINGIPLFYETFKLGSRDDMSDYYTSYSLSKAVSNVIMDVGAGGHTPAALEGTIYVPFEFLDMHRDAIMVMYINSVYQDADERIYLTASEEGMNLSMAEGHSITREEKRTITENGEKAETSFKVTINIEQKYSAISINIIQMSAENTLVSQQQYTLKTLPEKVALDARTEYVLVETRTPSSDGKSLEREIISRSDRSNERFCCYKAREDGFLEEVEVDLLWDK